jgi:hypothetical protein
MKIDITKVLTLHHKSTVLERVHLDFNGKHLDVYHRSNTIKQSQLDGMFLLKDFEANS